MPELKVHVDAPIGALQLQADITLTAPWTVLFGPSGSGKSSLLRLIAGLWTPKDSSVLFNGKDLTATPAHKRRIVLVSQQPALFPHLNVERNIGFHLSAGPEFREALDYYCEEFNLTHLRTANIRTLSGGERQRTAIARAIAASPQLLLLDEVFTGMHRTQSAELIAKLRAFRPAFPIPIVSVTHDVTEALESATEALKIENGRITAQGPTREVLAPEREALLARLA